MTDPEMKEMLVRIDERTKNMDERSKDFQETTVKRLDAHAASIKSIERFRFTVSGAWGLLAAALGIHIKGH